MIENQNSASGGADPRRDRGHWTEGRRSLEAALSLASEGELAYAADALWGAALLAEWQGDSETALEHATHLLDLSRACGGRRGEAIALQLIASTATDKGEFDRARHLFEESLVMAREVGDDWLMTVVLNNLGDVELNDGNYERAIELFEESLALGEERGDIDRRARQLTNLGTVSLMLGDGPAAAARFGDALATPTGRQWTESGFRERVWSKAVKAAMTNEQRKPGQRSVFEDFNFHLLRHTACSLMATAGMDEAVASERASHTDGGALFLTRYRHLYESEKRVQALRLEAFIRSELDSTWTGAEGGSDSSLDQAADDDGRGWDRTSDLPRVNWAGRD
jgi:tetratricopeptide (TPR) repeat protein